MDLLHQFDVARQRVVDGLQGTPPAPRPTVPGDLNVIRSGVEYDQQNQLRYYWFDLEITDADGYVQRQTKVVKLAMLAYLPRETREQMTVLEKMRQVLRGVCAARVDLIYLVAGIFHQPAQGIVQCYGVQGNADTLEESLSITETGMVTLQATLANFEQSQLEPLTLETAGWIRRAFLDMPYALTVIGHPDPRENPKGMDGLTVVPGQVASGAQIGLQQNEYLFRGMAHQKQEFLNVVIASHMGDTTPRQVFRQQERVAMELSVWESRVRFTRGINVGLALPLLLTGALTDGATAAYATTEAQGVAEGMGQAQTESHTEGGGESEAWGTAQTVGETQAVSHTVGTAHSVSTSHSHTSGDTDGTSHTDSENWGAADETGSSHTEGQATSHTEGRGTSHTEGSGASHTEGGGTAHTEGSAISKTEGKVSTKSTTSTTGSTSGSNVSNSIGVSPGASADVGGSVGVPGVASANASVGASASVSASHSEGTSATTSMGSSVTSTSSKMKSTTETSSQADTTSSNWADGTSTNVSDGVSSNVADGVSASQADGVSQGHVDSIGGGLSDGVSQAHLSSDTWGESEGLVRSQSTTTSIAQSRAVTKSTSQGVNRSWANAASDTTSRNHVASRNIGLSRGQALMAGRMLGASAGLSPHVSFTKSYQGYDAVADLVAQALKEQSAHLGTISKEGGLYVDNYFLTRNAQGRQAIEALVSQAFHGTEQVITPVRTRRLSPDEENYIRAHAMAFTPSTRLEGNPWALEPWKDTSLLTLIQTAAYTAPGVFEEGVAITVQERIPNFAFYPMMEGDVILGHFFSAETQQLTRTPVRLSQGRMANWAFCADTRYGKSVAAQRLALEMVKKWGYRTVILDFGFGWRKLVNMLPDEQVSLWSLYQGGPNPIRWNPLQIGRRIPPELQMSATVELLCNAGRLGERQAGWLWEVVRGLYASYGVLVDDPEVQEPETYHPDVLENPDKDIPGLPSAERKKRYPNFDMAMALAHVTRGERSLLHDLRARRGMPPLPDGGVRLTQLESWERQALAIERSKRVDLSMVYDNLEKLRRRLSRQPIDQQAIKGVMLRLKEFRYGQLAAMYGRGEGSIAIEDLAWPQGLALLEGGAMPEYAKAAVLSLIAWHIYTDAVVRRRQSVGDEGRFASMFLLFEEGNKVLGGIGGGSSDERPRHSEIFPGIFRDAGKYNIFLGVVAQSPSELDPGIMSSCNNLMFGQLKNGRDRDLVIAATGRSEKGFWSRDHVEFVGRLPQAMMVCKLGLSTKMREMTPMVMRPAMVACPEPSDAEIQ